MARALTAAEYEQGIASGDRAVLARAITLVESTRAQDEELSDAVVQAVLPRTGNAARVGITGTPGVGKSTFIEALGLQLTAAGHRVAVLAVDPSSARSGGSILGDKTRMPQLARDPAAYIRPSPGAGTLGGVARRTREAMLLCEAAGFDVVLVETIGVGQSETAVADMVDFFLLLMLAGAGDELQGIKRGIMESADAVVITKADGDNAARAEGTRAQFASALRLLCAGRQVPEVLTCSARDGAGMQDVWTTVTQHLDAVRADGRLDERRRRQALRWMEDAVDDLLRSRFLSHPAVAAALPGLRAEVLAGTLQPMAAARRLLDLAR